ncbi:hypothetical protein EDB83DRAFT_2310873 [Lactarius deliciosus]|nr:hypothetical protein EDB83DRAFT_2310873 [Lactarius deliciosus]
MRSRLGPDSAYKLSHDNYKRKYDNDTKGDTLQVCQRSFELHELQLPHPANATMTMTPVWQGGRRNHHNRAMPIDHDDKAMMPTVDHEDEVDHDDRTTQSDLGAKWQWADTGNDSDHLTTQTALRTTRTGNAAIGVILKRDSDKSTSCGGNYQDEVTLHHASDNSNACQGDDEDGEENILKAILKRHQSWLKEVWMSLSEELMDAGSTAFMLILDVKMRWLSTYQMLCQALQYHEAINTYI